MKTVTMRVDDAVYDIIQLAAKGEKRNISNFIEFATMQYLTSAQYIQNSEMAEILNDATLVESLKQGKEDVKPSFRTPFPHFIPNPIISPISCPKQVKNKVITL